MDTRDLIALATALARPFAPSPDVSAGTVAAALRTADGHVYTGICLDTASSLGFCAEHAAVAEMLKAREAAIAAIAAVNHRGEVLAPCGRCRELLWQVSPANAATWVALPGGDGARLADLLPRR